MPEKGKRLSDHKANAIIQAIQSSFNVGTLGLGVTGQISADSSLLTLVTVELVCSVLALILFVLETYNFIASRYLGEDRHRPNAYSATEHITFLAFRLISILASAIGLALIAVDVALGEEKRGMESAVGTTLVAIGIFASRALNGSLPKDVKVSEDDLEAGERRPLLRHRGSGQEAPNPE